MYEWALYIKNAIQHSEISILSILTDVVTVYGFIYGLPNFIKQLTAENTLNVANRIKDSLLVVEDGIIDLAKSREHERENAIKKLQPDLKQLSNLVRQLNVDIDQQKNLHNLFKIINDHIIGTNDAKIKFLDAIDPDWRATMQGAKKSKITIDFLEKLEKNTDSIIQNMPVSKTESLNTLLYISLISLVIFVTRIINVSWEFPLFVLLLISLLFKKIWQLIFTTIK
jgi:hypothetical protein